MRHQRIRHGGKKNTLDRSSNPEKRAETYACRLCNKTFQNGINLIRHQSNYNTPRPYSDVTDLYQYLNRIGK